jgi:hypothetical protein
MRTRGPDAPAYTWWPHDQTVGFWARRMAQETAVHRVDVEDGAGPDAHTPVDPELAVDGIDEVLGPFLSEDWADVTAEEWGDVDPNAAEGESVLIRSGGRTWRSTLGPLVIHLDRFDGSDDDGADTAAEASVAGDPEPVFLWLWGRRPDYLVDLDGDRAVLTAFRDRLRIATQ